MRWVCGKMKGGVGGGEAGSGIGKDRGGGKGH